MGKGRLRGYNLFKPLRHQAGISHTEINAIFLFSLLVAVKHFFSHLLSPYKTCFISSGDSGLDCHCHPSYDVILSPGSPRVVWEKFALKHQEKNAVGLGLNLLN